MKLMQRVFLSVFIFFLSIFSISTITFATSDLIESTNSATYSAVMVPTDNNIGVSKIMPGSYLYFLKGIREYFEMKFAGTSNVRLIRTLEFATRRLREVKALNLNNHEDLIPATLERYFSYIRELPEKGYEKTEISIRIKEGMVVHLETLENLYPNLSSPRAKLAVRSIINRLTQRVDIAPFAKIPACNFLAKEATSSAINESEKEILQQRAIICLQKPA